ncbi:hypothetical protein K461DRAFT_230991 [Myriangium duriaei CBS 260.36]|uniref:Zn(2)-C6 fungal-type domain-containing protein n=1 Tax=Myriangium duriaei CBS 260.36 TaxID=1168546 RepID=A0A9P4IVG6_9PEZI|nr:hypothetical protein K461DRAFT_230991 [Myriangium duriaei CBS 260.36]
MEENALSDDPESWRTAKQRRLNDNERQRAVQACDGCRRVKERCEGGVPCRRCKHFNRPCRLSKISSKDTRQQNPRSPSNESPSAHKALETIARHFIPTLSLDLASLQAVAKDLATGNSTLSDPRKLSSSSEDDEGTAVEEQCSVIPVQDNVAHYSGEFSYWNFSQRVRQHVKNLEDDNAVGASSETDNVSNSWRIEQLNLRQGVMSGAIKAFPPEPVARFLIKVFFMHACDSYFFVERKLLEETLRTAYRAPSRFGSEDAGKIAIILLVFAIGSQYAQLESSKDTGKNSTSISDLDQQLGLIFYQEAVQLLPDIIHLGSLESVQYTSLLAVYMLPIDAAGLAWIYSNLSIKLAIQNGMHRKAPKGLANTPWAEVRNRVWWTIYCIEKRISVFHGRPTSIATADIDVEMPVRVTELESVDQPFDVFLFCQSIDLIKELESIRGKIAALVKAADRKEMSAGLVDLLASSKALSTLWKDGDSGSSTQALSISRPALHVRLEFCLIRMFIGRPFMLSEAEPPSNANTPDDLRDLDTGSNVSVPSASRPKSQRAAQKMALVKDCVEAALEALKVCQTLQRSIEGLARASYVEYSSCRAALLVLIAHCINTKSSQHQQVIDTGLELISDMATTGESAKSDIMLIQTLERSMRRSVQMHQSRMVKLSAPTEHDGYEGFRNWMSSVQGLGPRQDIEKPAPSSQVPQIPSGSGQSSTASRGTLMDFPDSGGTYPLEALWTNSAMPSFFDLDDFNFALNDQGFFNQNI